MAVSVKDPDNKGLEKARDGVDNAFGALLAQLRHLRHHKKDEIGPMTRAKLDSYLNASQVMLEEFTSADLST